MRPVLHSILSVVDKVSKFFGWLARWLCIILVALTVEQVLARHYFNGASVALQELEWHLFGLIFLLATAETLRQDAHVRVDLIYSRCSKKVRAIIDSAGILIFLVPMCLVLIYYGYNYTLQAFSFDNPRPPDFYSAQFFSKDGSLYTVFSSLEGLLRKTVLTGQISPDPGGLEARWIIKAAIPFAFILLLLQGLAELVRKLALIFGYSGDLADER
ncbi:MAG: TRAP transporter small permease subunit [Candidatus Dadabacteria bacterium]|nr:MAG: TRAP transporter small permease subunit [Candidatus Dadabacteria bacterium]